MLSQVLTQIAVDPNPTPVPWRVLTMVAYFVGLLTTFGGTLLYVLVVAPVLARPSVDPADRDVLRRFLMTAGPEGSAVVRTLRLDGRPAAAQLAVTTGDTLELLKVAYDEDLADLSPSNLLMADLVRSCCERADVARIDLVTNQPWHTRWHPETHPT